MGPDGRFVGIKEHQLTILSFDCMGGMTADTKVWLRDLIDALCDADRTVNRGVIAGRVWSSVSTSLQRSLAYNALLANGRLLPPAREVGQPAAPSQGSSQGSASVPSLPRPELAAGSQPSARQRPTAAGPAPGRRQSHQLSQSPESEVLSEGNAALAATKSSSSSNKRTDRRHPAGSSAAVAGALPGVAAGALSQPQRFFKSGSSADAAVAAHIASGRRRLRSSSASDGARSGAQVKRPRRSGTGTSRGAASVELESHTDSEGSVGSGGGSAVSHTAGPPRGAGPPLAGAGSKAGAMRSTRRLRQQDTASGSASFTTGGGGGQPEVQDLEEPKFFVGGEAAEAGPGQ